MKIHNPHDLPTIDYRKVKPLQGDLKDLSVANHDKLLRVLNKRGFTTPLFIWKDGPVSYLLDGHQRQRVMQKNDLNDNGIYQVPYVLIPADDIKEAKEQLLEITSQYGHMTIEGLEEFAADLGLTELDVSFDAIDMDKLMDSLSDDENDEDDEAPEVDDKSPAFSRLGEIYQLGSHRLMCGSATEYGDITELLNGATIDLVLTDPPYGIDVVQNKQVGGAAPTKFGGKTGSVVQSSTYRPIVNDDTTDTAKASYQALKEIGVANFIMWGGNYFTDFLFPSPCWIVWDKQNTGNFADVEMAWTSFDKGAKLYTHMWNGMAREGAREDELATRVHPTQKPVGIHASILKDFTKPSSSVLDVFGGSGTTLVACEKTGRICYMMELDPKYCDVIRKRYHKLVSGDEEGWEDATRT